MHTHFTAVVQSSFAFQRDVRFQTSAHVYNTHTRARFVSEIHTLTEIHRHTDVYIHKSLQWLKARSLSKGIFAIGRDARGDVCRETPRSTPGACVDTLVTPSQSIHVYTKQYTQRCSV